MVDKSWLFQAGVMDLLSRTMVILLLLLWLLLQLLQLLACLNEKPISFNLVLDIFICLQKTAIK